MLVHIARRLIITSGEKVIQDRETTKKIPKRTNVQEIYRHFLDPTIAQFASCKLWSMEYFELTVTRGTNTSSPTIIHRSRDLSPGLCKNVDGIVASSRVPPASPLCPSEKGEFPLNSRFSLDDKEVERDRQSVHVLLFFPLEEGLPAAHYPRN